LIFGREHVVVSCEHASFRIPPALRHLGVAPAARRSHVAWDPGAAEIARQCAAAVGAPLHLGRWSRLVVDLNRSLDHPKLIATESFGIEVPGNAGLSTQEREERVRRFWWPYRRAVDADLARAMSRYGRCLHVSVHSFTPVAHGRVRPTEIGLLFDPSRRRERAVAEALRAFLRTDAPRLAVHANRPYRGTSDGFTTHLRRAHAASRYAGVEVEVNQKLLTSRAKVERLARLVARCLAEVLVATSEAA
jgi:predicted N-formylglutamate amidohydrolase